MPEKESPWGEKDSAQNSGASAQKENSGQQKEEGKLAFRIVSKGAVENVEVSLRLSQGKERGSNSAPYMCKKHLHE